MNWITMVLRDRWMAFDIASVTVLFVILFRGVRDQTIEYSRNLALSALFLALVYILLPRIVFGSAYADMRLAPFMLAFAIIALRPRNRLSLRGAATLAVLGFSFFAVRLAGTTISFLIYDRSYDQAIAAIDTVPERARVVSFVGRRCRDDWAYSRLEHVPALLLERRLAFTNDQWSMAGGQLMTTRYPIARGFAHDPSEIVTDIRCRGQFWRPIAMALEHFPREAFDYVWLIHPPAFDPALIRDLTPIRRDGTSVLYKVNRSAVPPAETE
jgi:hypothetical protein